MFYATGPRYYMRDFGKQKQLSVCARKSKKEHRYIFHKNFLQKHIF